MPIVDTTNSDTPLSQGDILEGIALAVTNGPWISNGTLAKAPAKLCLVLSRPCVLGHKQQMVVAGVRLWPNAIPKDVSDYSTLKDFFEVMRDGNDSPDVFYLGQLPSRPGRYCAELDSIHTVELPADHQQRHQLIKEKRIGRLTFDFLRDLHVRLFRCFASLGFDDTKWYSTDDLRQIEALGNADVAKLQQDLSMLKAKQHGLTADGRSMAEKEVAQIKTMEEKLNTIKMEIQLLSGELENRSKVTDISSIE